MSTKTKITQPEDDKTFILAPGQWKLFRGIKIENITKEMLKVKIELIKGE